MLKSRTWVRAFVSKTCTPLVNLMTWRHLTEPPISEPEFLTIAKIVI